MSVTSRRRLSIFIAFCLFFTQTAQAYSLTWLPYKYQPTRSSHTETLSTDGFNIQANATRRINNKAESQTQANQLTRLASAQATSPPTRAATP